MMLVKSREIEAVGTDVAGQFQTEDLLKEETDILLLSSRGNKNEDLNAVRRVRTTAPNVQILLMEKPPLSHEAQNRRRGPPGHRPGLPDPGIHAVEFGYPVAQLLTYKASEVRSSPGVEP